MQASTRMPRLGEFATGLDRTMENSNMEQLLSAVEESWCPQICP
jgi:hypothetical protein